MLGGWGQEEKGTTEDEMAAGWHHWLDGCEFEWTSEVSDEQGGLACCNSWGRKESDMTERLNWTEQMNCKIDKLVPQDWGFSIQWKMKVFFGMRGERDDLRRFRDRRRSGTISLEITKRKMFEVVDRLVF